MIKFIKYIILIVSVITSVICINDTEDLYLLPLLPLCFGVLFYTCVSNKSRIGAGQTMLYVVLSFRYILYPIMLVSEGFQLMFPSTHTPQAIMLMLFEMLIIFLTIKVYKRKRRRNIRRYLTISRPVIYKGIIPISIILFAILAFAFPEAFVNQHFIWESEEIKEDAEIISGVIGKPLSWVRFFAEISVFSYLYYKYLITKNSIYLNLSILPILIPCLWYSGESRVSFMVPAVAAIFTILKSYGFSKTKIQITTIAMVVFFVLIVLSLQKHLDTSSLSDTSGIFSANLLNSYFGGIDNINVGIDSYNKFGNSLYLLFIDSFRNMMVVSRFLNEIPIGSGKFFNLTFYGSDLASDQIVPTIIQGFMFFGPLFCFLPTFIMVYVTCKVDDLWYKTNNMYIAFMLVSFVTMVGFAVPGSWMHMTSRICNDVIPLLILIKIVDIVFPKVQKKKRIYIVNRKKHNK